MLVSDGACLKYNQCVFVFLRLHYVNTFSEVFISSQEGDDTILVRVVPAKSSRPPGRIQMNFEDLEKNREEELKKKAEEEKKRQYEENKRSFREVKRRSVVEQVRFQGLSLDFLTSSSSCLSQLHSSVLLDSGRRGKIFREGAGDSWKTEDVFRRDREGKAGAEEEEGRGGGQTSPAGGEESF